MNITEIVRPVSTTTVPKVIYNLLQKHEFSTINENSDDRQQILVDDFSRREEIDSNLFKVPLTIESKKYLVKDVLPRMSWVAENEKTQKILDNFQNKMNSKVSLEEAAQRRISHPEDLALHGSEGINIAISAISHIAKDSSSVTIKFDGTPSLLFGRNENGELVITDKSGFNSKTYDGHAKSAKDLFNMLYSRNMDQAGRKEFSQQMAGLWPLFEQAIPENMNGYYQGDLMYVGRPQIKGDSFVFKPNKILYQVPVKSELGQRISKSKACIVVHGYYKDRESSVTPVQDVENLQKNPALLVMNTSLQGDMPNINISPPKIQQTNEIDSFINPAILKGQKLSDLPRQIGRYINFLASQGRNDYSNAPQKFLEWVTNSSLTERKKSNIRNYVKSEITGYNALWNAIVDIAKFKDSVKSQIDKASSQNIRAYLGNKPAHEGYVVNTPYGTIKLVDRHEFMKK